MYIEKISIVLLSYIRSLLISYIGETKCEMAGLRLSLTVNMETIKTHKGGDKHPMGACMWRKVTPTAYFFLLKIY